jgi:multidrug resistance efflux pump
MVIDPVSGEHVPNTLTDAQKAEYVYALIVAERNLHEAERNVDLAQRALDQARADEIQLNQHADKQITEAQRALDQVLADAVHGDPQLVAARQDVQDAQRVVEAAKRRTTDQQARVKNARVALEAAKRGTSGSEQTAVKVAELGVESAQQGQLNIQQTAVEQAQLALDKARRKVDAARVIAPRDGVFSLWPLAKVSSSKHSLQLSRSLIHQGWSWLLSLAGSRCASSARDDRP